MGFPKTIHRLAGFSLACLLLTAFCLFLGGAEGRLPRHPEKPVDGELAAGLTPSQVQRILGGPPAHVARTGVFGKVIEQWVYHTAEGGIYINFRLVPGLPAQVVEWHSFD